MFLQEHKRSAFHRQTLRQEGNGERSLGDAALRLPSDENKAANVSAGILLQSQSSCEMFLQEH